MSVEDVDEYLRGVDEAERAVLQTLRSAIVEVVPEAEQTISYGVPAFRVHGTTIAGFAAFKNHLSYLPSAAQSSHSSPMSLATTR